jgi:predicted PurR-regulated permease PerM
VLSDRDRSILPVLRIAAIVVTAYVLAALLSPVLQISLLIFSGLLLAIALDAAASWSARFCHLPRGLALALVASLSVLGFVGFVVTFAPSLVAQLEQLWSILPRALDRMGEQLGQQAWGERFMARVPTIEEVIGSESVLRNAFGALSGVVGALGAAFLVMFVGLFVAIDPGVYLRGMRFLAGPARRDCWEQLLITMTAAMRRWLLTKLASMVLIGVVTWIGLTIIGIPLAPALGVLAAALTFIPNIGPVLAGVPAVLLGFLDGPTTALVVLALYVGIQIVEGYIFSPMLQRRMLSLPPALTLGVQALLGVIAGSMGVVVATPMLAAATAALMTKAGTEPDPG